MWQQLPITAPVDTQIVWVRTNRWSGAPFQAEFSKTKEGFTIVSTGYFYPIYELSYWKP